MVGQIVTKVTRGGLDFNLLSTTNTRHASLLTQTYSHLQVSLPCERQYTMTLIISTPEFAINQNQTKNPLSNIKSQTCITTGTSVFKGYFFWKGEEMMEEKYMDHVQEETCILYPSDYKSPHWILSCVLKLFPVHQQLTFLLIYWRQSKTMHTERQSTLKRITSFSILLSWSKLLVYFSIVGKSLP